MIRDSNLTYASSASLWYQDEFENTTVNALAIAAAMTLISYQITAIIFDLALGFKQKWRASISKLHILLITRKATPLVVFNNLLRMDWLTRLYYWGEIPHGTQIGREKERVRVGTGLVLLFLLAVAPVINIISVVLTLERETTLTFEEAGFGGVSFGVKPGLGVTAEERLSELCVRVPVLSRPGDTPLAEFSLCKLPWIGRNEPNPVGLVSISVADAHQVLITVQLGSNSVELYKTANLYANRSSWVLKPSISPESVEELVDVGMGYVSEVCGVPDDIKPVDTYISFTDPVRENIMAKRVPCDIEGDTRTKCARILALVEKHVTLIDAGVLEVAKKPVALTAAQFLRGEDMEFIRRRQLFVGVSVLWIIAAVTVVLRVATALFWNNDIGDGIEGIVKESLGVSCCSSLLKAEENRIVYNNKCQAGKQAHFGLEKQHWPVVNQFEGGTVGVSSYARMMEDGECLSDVDSSFRGVQMDV